MKHVFTLCLFAAMACMLHAQQTIDGAFAFQTDPAKKYSLYIPSSYEANTPNKLMVGFHPFNVQRWDAESWRDTLTAFAETNDLILMCPDGGSDGQVDGDIDTAFTTALLDSVKLWYNINEDKIFAVGFSWGGRTTYTYGLSHVDIFAGFMVIGAAVNGTQQVNGIIQNAKDKPYAVIHGQNDAPQTRFFPMVDALNMAEACVNDTLMAGIIHTIDFPNRNAIMTRYFNWLDTVQCGEILSSIPNVQVESLVLAPNICRKGQSLRITHSETSFFEGMSYQLYNMNGQLIRNERYQTRLQTDNLERGLYFVELRKNDVKYIGKFEVVH